MAHFLQQLGVSLPLIQSPMAGLQDSALTIAVSDAGGLGSLPAAMLTPQALQQELDLLSQRKQPYNLNFFCHQMPTYDTEQQEVWQTVLAPYYKAYGITATNQNPAAASAPFNAEMLNLLEHYKPPFLSFHFGLPEPALCQQLKKWRTKIISTATTIAEALYLQERGVDAIIAQGLEAGGHRGHFLTDDLSVQMGTFALLPQIVKAVHCPVIAAGGISDATGVAAALSLGAAAVQVGTAYLLCPEAKTTPLHRAAIKSSAAQHTALTNLFSGRPARAIMNKLMQELGPMNAKAPPFPLARAAITPLRAAAEQTGCSDFSPMWCGQNVSGCQEISAFELTQQLCKGVKTLK